MYKQELGDFPLDVQKYGCYFFCLLRMCEIEAGVTFTKEQINDIYAHCRMKGYIGAQCSCLSPDNVCRYALDSVQCKKSILQVGDIDKNGKPSFWNWANKKPYNDPQYVALSFATGGPIGHHYILANAMQEVIFDPSSHDYTKNSKLGGLLHKAL